MVGTRSLSSGRPPGSGLWPARWQAPAGPVGFAHPTAPARRVYRHPLSEIRLVRDRDVIIEQVLIVLGADFLAQRLLQPPVTLDNQPRLIENVRILTREITLH